MSELVVNDLINSWWALPCAVFDSIRNQVHVTGVTRGGALKVGTFDLALRTTRETSLGGSGFTPDDHYTPAVSFDLVDGIEARPPVVAWSFHDQEGSFHLRRGSGFDLSSLGAESVVAPSGAVDISYATLLRRTGTPNTMVLTGRMLVSSTTGHYMIRSTDGGATWSAPYRLHGKDYFTWRLSLDGNTAYCATTLHPTSSGNPEPKVHVFKINLTTGDMTNWSNATLIGNLWTDTPAGQTAIISTAEMDEVVASDATYSHRLLDVSPDGTAVLLAKFLRADRTNGTFMVRRFSGGSWTTEEIGPTGAPFGYTTSYYIGGGVFDGDGSTAYLVQDSASRGRSAIARWVRDDSGIWNRRETIRVAPSGGKIGRPRVPQGAEGLGIVTWGEYTRYAPDNFNDYYARQRISDRRQP